MVICSKDSVSMKCASVPSEYRNCILRASVRTDRNFSPARNVRSITAPSAVRRSLVRTNAPPLPGLTCWNSRILKTVPSISMWFPFLNWFVEIMCAAKGIRRACRGYARAVSEQAAIYPQPDGVRLWLEHGSSLPDPHRLLEGEGRGRYIAVASADSVPAE